MAQTTQTTTRHPSRHQLASVPPFFFIQLDAWDGKVHPDAHTTEAIRYYIVDRKKRIRQTNPALLRDPSVTRISAGWEKVKQNGSPDGGGASPSQGPRPGAMLPDTGVGSRATGCPGKPVEGLLALYFQTVVPIAQGFSSRWKWCDDAKHVRSSPMLAYAAAAYASAFSLVFDCRDPSLSNLWLDLQTKSLSLLRKALTTEGLGEDCVPTITLFMRLALLLGDWETASWHADALQSILDQRREERMDMRIERSFVGPDGQPRTLRLLGQQRPSKLS